MTIEEFKKYLDEGVRVFQVWGHPTLGSRTFVKYTGSSKYVVDNYRFFHTFTPYYCMGTAWIHLSYIRAIKICPCCEKSLMGRN